MDGFLRNNKFFILFLVMLIYLVSGKYRGMQSSDTWIMPVDGVITQEFNVDGIGKEHHGLDIGCGITQVHASNSGIVEFAGWKNEIYANTVIIKHSGNMESLYAHNSEILVKVGDKVMQGDVIAMSGGEGLGSTGIHSHWEIRKNGVCVNPLTYVKNNSIVKSKNDNEEPPSKFNINEPLPEDIDNL